MGSMMATGYNIFGPKVQAQIVTQASGDAHQVAATLRRFSAQQLAGSAEELTRLVARFKVAA